DLFDQLAQLLELARELLVERLALGGLFEALAHLLRRVVQLLRQFLLALERALQLLAALEALRALRLRTRLLARQLVERLLQLLRLLGDLLERVLCGLLLLVHVVVEIGERGEAELERRTHRASRPRDRVVVEQLEAERRALARQQRERGRVP